ncbi:hypothetical protein DFH09DRAFT_1113510 [Mycena vulgaris]|nr:hypothetical protein DFH09DRAFT_1113510 [Mycena vulgaris]
MNEAKDLGFPSIKGEMIVAGSSCDSNIYAGLWQFHQGKGFSHESQDLARHLCYPLFAHDESVYYDGFYLLFTQSRYSTVEEHKRSLADEDLGRDEDSGKNHGEDESIDEVRGNQPILSG